LTVALFGVTKCDMNKKPRRYHSPLRAAQAEETREAILRGVATWMQQKPHEKFTLDGIARLAGIERRTVFRHFPDKDALRTAFWEWINRRILPRILPASLAELRQAPRTTFAAFDAEEALIRASLHTSAGRQMRLARVADRRRAFRAALGEVTRSASAAERRNLECVAHALYSAAAWETMRDYAGVTGPQAGAAVSWALTVLTEAVGRSTTRRTSTPQKE
jgi:AcrR family transcriptional regulator